MLTEVYASSVFIWKIDNVSKLDILDGLDSDVFVVGGRTWKAQVYPTDFLLVSLIPADDDSIEFPEDAVKFSVAIHSQTNGLATMTSELKDAFAEQSCVGYGRPLSFPFSELHDSSKGYIVNDSCVIKFEVSCSVNNDSMDSDNKESDPADSSSESVSNMQTDRSTIGEHSGQTFKEGQHSSKSGFCEAEEYEDIGGFRILKTQASLYKQILAKYGHIPPTRDSVLVMVVKDLMSSVIDMHQCRFVELSTEMIQVWEKKIKMAEKLELNISWLRERFETVKKNVSGMQKLKTELLEHGQPLRAAKSKMKALEDELKKAETELNAAKNHVNASGLLSESDMEIYLEIGENLLFDGLF
ncbi:hypothetical protein MKX01_013618 [Papaver californicum]|nr:hypothetical protein MKX01_013618 [Papaver californicum]